MHLNRLICLVIILCSWQVTATPLTGRIEALIEQGQLKEAISITDAQLAKDDTNVNFLFLKGLILTKQNKLNQAKEVFVKLTEQHPELPEPFNNLAVVYAALGDFTSARQALQQAINTHPSYATAHENMGDIYAKMASNAYNQALELDENNTTAREKLAMINELFSAKVNEQQVAMINERQAEIEQADIQLEQLKQTLQSTVEQTRQEKARLDQLQVDIKALEQERASALRQSRVQEAEIQARTEQATIKAEQSMVELSKEKHEIEAAIERAKVEQGKAEKQAQLQREKVDRIVSELAELEETKKQAVQQAKLAQTEAEQRAEQALLKAEQTRAELIVLEQTRLTTLEQAQADQNDAKAQVLQTQAKLEKMRNNLAKLQQEQIQTSQQVEVELAKIEQIRDSQQKQKLVKANISQPGDEDVIKVVLEWVEYWSAQNVDGYLSFYGADFVPEKGMSRQRWENQRKQRLRKPRFIKVEINDPKVTFLGREHAQVNFNQKYQSDTYSDQVAKTLLMKYKDNRWFIVEEKTN